MRHGLQDNDNRIMCLQASETLDRILLGCVLSCQVWSLLLSRIGLADVVAPGDVGIFVWWSWAQRRVPRASMKGFDSLVMLTGWSLWKERNARTFRNEATQAHGLCLAILEETCLLVRETFGYLCARFVLFCWDVFYLILMKYVL